MAKKQGSENAGIRTPDWLALCANGCGFYGSAATGGMCSKCYRGHATGAGEADLMEKIRTSLVSLEITARGKEQPQAEPAARSAPAPEPASTRCEACRRKVGLLGFPCRCGGTFCGRHRHAEAHGCGVDYKTAGREQIARENPAVVAAKLAKI